MQEQATSYRIVLADLKNLVADMIEREVDAVSDAAVVGRVDSLAELAEITRATGANVIVTGLEAPGLLSACRDVLYDQPRAKVLGILEATGASYLYVLRPEERYLGELSASEIVHAVQDPLGERD